MKSLEAAGLLKRAEGDVLDLGRPVEVKCGRKSGSRRLAEMREHERQPVIHRDSPHPVTRWRRRARSETPVR